MTTRATCRTPTTSGTCGRTASTSSSKHRLALNERPGGKPPGLFFCVVQAVALGRASDYSPADKSPWERERPIMTVKSKSKPNPKFDKKLLPSRHVSVGPTSAPHRAFYYAMGMTEREI